MFKFIHTADIHLDSPLIGLSQYDGAPVDLLRNATRQAFENLVQLAIDEQVAFMVIAGDLYDGEWKDFNTGLFFTSQMGKLREAEIQAFVLLGNHDAESQLTKTLRLPDNVHTFSTRKAESIELSELGVALHGQSFKTRDTTDNLASNYPDPVSGALNIGVLHTALEGNANHAHYAPCSVSELVNKGYDYWALGHVHASEVLHREPYVVFPGNLQGRHVKETGPKGAMLVSVDGGQITQVEPIFVDVARWAVLEVDASGATTKAEIQDRVHSELEHAIANEAEGRSLAVRLIITGKCSAHNQILANEEEFRADVRAIAAGLGADSAWVEKIKLETQPDLDQALSKDRQDAVGELQRLLDQATEDQDLVKSLEEDLGELLAKLPSEIRIGLEDGLLKAIRDDQMTEVIQEAGKFATSRILGTGA